MKTMLKAGLAALVAAGTVAATASPASADGYWGGRGYYGRGYDHDRGYGGGALIAGGLAGLAVGAALAQPHYAYGYGYRPAYYGPRYGYETCVVRRNVWDPYYGGYVVRRVNVPC